MKKNSPGNDCCAGCVIWRVDDVLNTVTPDPNGTYPLPDLPETDWMITVQHANPADENTTGVTIDVLDDQGAVIATIPVGIPTGATPFVWPNMPGSDWLQTTTVDALDIESTFGLWGYDPAENLIADRFRGVFVSRADGVMLTGYGISAVSSEATPRNAAFSGGWVVGSTPMDATQFGGGGIWTPPLPGTGTRSLRVNDGGQNFQFSVVALQVSDPAEDPPACTDHHMSKLTDERGQPRWELKTQDILPGTLVTSIDSLAFNISSSTQQRFALSDAPVITAPYTGRITFPNAPSLDGAFWTDSANIPASQTYYTNLPTLDVSVNIISRDATNTTVRITLELDAVLWGHSDPPPSNLSASPTGPGVATGNPNEVEYTWEPGAVLSSMSWEWEKVVPTWSGPVPTIVCSGDEASSIVLYSPSFPFTDTLNAFLRNEPWYWWFGTEAATPPEIATNTVGYRITPMDLTTFTPDYINLTIGPHTAITPQPS